MTVALSDILIGVFSTTLQLSPFYLFAGMGEIVSEQSGVANMGLEGIMLMSLMTTFVVDYMTGNPWVALLAAIGVAAVIGALFAFTAIRLRMDQIASGLAIYLVGLGLSFVIFNTVYPSGLTPNYIPLPSLTTNWNVIPYVGIIFLKQNVMAYVSLVLVVVTAFFLTRTSLGLRVKAVGENPKAADNMGVNVNKVRFLATLFAALTFGVAGFYFAGNFVPGFQTDVIAGRGFIVLAMIYFANWKPYRTLFAALSFNIVYAAQNEYVTLSGFGVASVSTLFNMLPYVFLLALIPVFGRKARVPKFLLKPYRKG
ncbi:MAG TPA: ABC transporter permease [Nitrososphaerales archaeon]|nr:ABC transporter permease [Nitrososphaerales archaeon]